MWSVYDMPSSIALCVNIVTVVQTLPSIDLVYNCLHYFKQLYLIAKQIQILVPVIHAQIHTCY